MENQGESNNQKSQASGEEQPPNGKLPERKGYKELEKIHALRERLYARGKAPGEHTRHRLTAIEEIQKQQHLRDQAEQEKQKKAEELQPMNMPKEETLLPRMTEAKPQEEHLVSTPSTMPSRRRKGYRIQIVIAAVAFFIAALALSSLFLFSGSNTISGENITIDVSGPFAVGGGEKMPFQVAISNQNNIPIEAATLIVNYPPGTQSATQPGKELAPERTQLNNIAAGEVVNIPLQAVVFGEENEEKSINVSVEYRVRGSNATFYKEADPLRFKISSSPVVISVDTVKSISSGQEMEIKLIVGSNSPTQLTDILVKASYPFGFDYSSSEPDSVSGQDTWLIESLEPEAKKEIVIKGILVGKQDENRIFNFSVGVPNERDRFILASTFTTVTTEIAIEQPFLGVGVKINNENSSTVVIDDSRAANIEISFENTLDDTIYDGTVVAKLDGNALNDIDVKVLDGFYDSTKNTITWDSVDVDGLSQIAPGKTNTVNFTLDPRKDIGRTPEITIEVTVTGKRIFEDRVPQELVGTAERTIRIASVASLTSSALYSEGPFTNTGPIPPVAEKVTQYAYLLTVENGSNDITDAEVIATVPQYITWLDLVSAGDEVTYNPATREIVWDVGNLDANEQEEVWVQVSFLPSLSQVGSVPTLLGTQRLRATDRFTGTVLRADAPALTTALVNDPDEEAHNGSIRASE